jgi:hypothetical protein
MVVNSGERNSSPAFCRNEVLWDAENWSGKKSGAALG